MRPYKITLSIKEMWKIHFMDEYIINDIPHTMTKKLKFLF